VKHHEDFADNHVEQVVVVEEELNDELAFLHYFAKISI